MVRLPGSEQMSKMNEKPCEVEAWIGLVDVNIYEPDAWLQTATGPRDRTDNLQRPTAFCLPMAS